MAIQGKKSLKRTINLKQLLKCVGVIVLALYLSVTLLDQQRRINDNLARTQEYRELMEYANLQTALLEEEIAIVGTDEHIEHIARSQLRLAMPGDMIFIDSARVR